MPRRGKVPVFPDPAMIRDMTVLNAIGPVFLLMLTGALLHRSGRLCGDMVQRLNWINYWVALPALLIVKISAAPPDFAGAGRAGAVVGGCALLSLALCGPFIMLLKLKGPELGAFLQAGFRGNLAFLALPVVIYSAAADVSAQRAALGALVLGVVVPLYNLISVIVLLIGRHELGVRSIPLILRKVFSNPLLIGCAIGLTLSWGDASLGLLLSRTLSAMGAFSLPTALLCIGGVIAEMGLRGRVLPACAATMVKSVLTPFVGFLIARSCGLSEHEMIVTLLFLGAPSAVAGYVMAQQMGADESLAATSVMLSTLVSLGSMAVIVHLFA